MIVHYRRDFCASGAMINKNFWRPSFIKGKGDWNATYEIAVYNFYVSFNAEK